MKNFKYFAVLLATVCASATLSAQQVSTLYFMKNLPARGDYNPAFQPTHNIWVDLPLAFRLSAGSNSLGFNDIFLLENGKTITFLHPGANPDKFYKSLNKNTRIYSDFTIGILGFGFRKDKHYFSFNLSEKISMGVYLPKDLFKFALYGTGDNYQDNFNWKRIGVNASVYTEFAFGYSRVIGDKLTVGGKLKFLMGQLNVNTNFKKLNLNAGIDEWNLDAKGALNISIPWFNMPKTQDNTIDFENFKFKDMFNFDDMSKKAILKNVFAPNCGLGFDLGANYKLLPNLQLSAAVTDLGFIRWTNNSNKISVNGNYLIDGIVENTDDGFKLKDFLGEFTEAFELGCSNKAYATALNARVNIGAEYSLWKDRFGVGLLWTSQFANKTMFQNLTLSANLRPVNWFSTTVCYSFLHGQAQTIGFGIQLLASPFNMYIALDNIPLSFAKTKESKMVIPTNSGINLQMGWCLVFGNPDKIAEKKQRKIEKQQRKDEATAPRHDEKNL